MSKWIDAEWLMNFFVDIPDNFTLTIGNLRATVNEAPSIDIVRCKECKYKDKTANYCYENDRNIKSDDFCSYGQKGDENVETD